MSHQFDPTILREYDIRGTVGETLGTDDAHAIGRGFATIARERAGASAGLTIGTAYDGRLSSPDLVGALSDGLCAGGVDVVNVGMGPTPMLYFAVHELGLDGGIMVTGSHNPPDMNGFKLMLGTASFFGEDIAALGPLAANGRFSSGRGETTYRDVMGDYLRALVGGYSSKNGLTIAWDSGNGSAGPMMEAMTARLPGRHILLNANVDGTFPAHHPDPTVPENLVQLQKAVADNGCDIGIAFDGDGDRIGAMDGKGRIIWGDQLLALLAEEVLAANPGATVIADVKASKALFDRIAELGGAPVMWKTGHSLIKAKMKETGAPLAGEMSGHVMFADRYYGYDDALYVAARFASMVADSDESLADLYDRLPVMVNTPELRFPCDDRRKFAVIDEIRDRLSASDDAGAVNPIDGVRVETDAGWWLIRASNTQPVLVARAEATTEAALEDLKATMARQLADSGVDSPFARPTSH